MLILLVINKGILIKCRDWEQMYYFCSAEWFLVMLHLRHLPLFSHISNTKLERWLNRPVLCLRLVSESHVLPFFLMEILETSEKFQMTGKAFLLYFIHMYVINNYLVDSLICPNLCRHNGNWQCNFPLKIVNGWLSWVIHLPPVPFVQICYTRMAILWK